MFSGLIVGLSLVVVATAQKGDVEWLFPPSGSPSGANDVFNQGFGPPDFFGGGGLGGSPLGPDLGIPGSGGIPGGQSPGGYKVNKSIL